MMNKLPPFKGVNIWIPILVPITGRGLISQGLGDGLGLRNSGALRTDTCKAFELKLDYWHTEGTGGIAPLK